MYTAGSWKKRGALVIVAWIAAATIAWIPGRAVAADDKDPKPADTVEEEVSFWLKAGSLSKKPTLGAWLVGLRNPYTIGAILHSERHAWRPLKIEENEEKEEDRLAKLKFSPTLDPNLVKSLAAFDLKTVPQLDNRPANADERNYLKLYTQAAFYSQFTPVEAFEASAKAFKNVTFGHLYENPKDYWGKEVTLAGKLYRVRERPAPHLARNKGVQTLYEGYIQTPTRDSNPVVAIFPHLPAGIEVAETITPPKPVTFHGYFLGRVRYRAVDKDRVTLLLIGPTLIPEKAAAPKEGGSPWTPLAYIVLYGLLGIAGLVIVLALGFKWMYWKGDRQVRERLARLHAERTMRGLENVERTGIMDPAVANRIQEGPPPKVEDAGLANRIQEGPPPT
jgi:hypothetical protein